MTKLKTIVNSLLAIGLASAIFSCNSNTETAKEEPKKMADSPVVSQPAAPTPVAQAQAPAPFTPFDIAEISHKVKDYAKWRLVFNTDSVNRKAAGMEDLVVSSVIDNNNDIEIVLKVSDIQKAKDFAANPKLKEAMEKGGVISKPATASPKSMDVPGSFKFKRGERISETRTSTLLKELLRSSTKAFSTPVLG